MKPQNNEILEEAKTRNPTNAEIKLTLKEMRDEAPGDDGMRLRYISLQLQQLRASYMR